MPAPDHAQVAAFREETADLLRKARGAAAELRRTSNRLRHMRQALDDTPSAEAFLYSRLNQLEATLAGLSLRLFGDRTRGRWNEPGVPSILGRVRSVARGHWNTRQAPTETQKHSLQVAGNEFAELNTELKTFLETDLADFEAALEAAGAPWTPGRKLPGQ